jgi:RNA polymerase sigma-70 factor (ECF subfamily)
VENEIVSASVTAALGKRVFSAEPTETRQPEAGYFRELVRAILAGETARFDEIVSLFRERVYRIAWRMAQDREDALDIAQEVFLRSFRALRSWHGRARFSTWLHRIAVNASIDYIRRQTKYRDRTDSFDDMTPEAVAAIEAKSAPFDEPRRLAYAKELRREIFDAVRRLPRRQRRCFVLRHYHECSIRDIATVLGITEGAVKRHLHRASRRLRSDLAARLSSTGR